MKLRETLNKLFSFIPAPWRLVVAGGLALVLILTLWVYGARVKNNLSSWWFNRGTEKVEKEIQDYKNLAQETLKELELEKQRTAEERARREFLEKLLADKTKTTNQKLEVYAKVIAASPAVSGSQSTDELCTRAQALGLSCD